MFRVHPFSCAAQLKPPHTSLRRRLKDDPMKTKHFTSVGPPSTEKTIRLPLPAIEVRERPPFTKYRPNVIEIETTPVNAVSSMPRIWPRSPEADLRQLGDDGPWPAVAPQERRYSWHSL